MISTKIFQTFMLIIMGITMSIYSYDWTSSFVPGKIIVKEYNASDVRLSLSAPDIDNPSNSSLYELQFHDWESVKGMMAVLLHAKSLNSTVKLACDGKDKDGSGRYIKWMVTVIDE